LTNRPQKSWLAKAGCEHPVVARDYYAVLGVTPASEDVVIRAAYRALMRRYHPDADPSSEASQRAASINAAYAVLSDPEKRARYDGSLAAQRLIKTEPDKRHGLSRYLPGPAGLFALGTLAVALTAIAISPPIGVLPPDTLAGAAQQRAVSASRLREAAAAKAQAADGAYCDDPSVPRLIRAELVRQAGLLRDADGEILQVVGNSANVRLDSPTFRGEGGIDAVGCSAWLSVNLPPGVVVEGGRTNLNGEVAFGLLRTADKGFRLASLSGASGLVRSLATAAPPPREQISDDDLKPEEIASVKPLPPQVVRPGELPETKGKLVEVVSTKRHSAAAPVETAKTAATAQADLSSPHCRALTGWADKAVCNNSNLAGLDRQLALLYRQSWAEADAAKRTSLSSTRDQFIDRRNACRSDPCLTSAYVSRLREVSDIMRRRSQ
jgi:hypothetical protein